MPDGEILVSDLPDWEALLAEPVACEQPEHSSELFRKSRYDWAHPDWLARDLTDPFAWVPIFLNQDYFMMVSTSAYERMTLYPEGGQKSWNVNIQRHPEDGSVRQVYAKRTGRKGEPQLVYAHREIVGAIHASRFQLVDHKNGLKLDNRGTEDMEINLRWVGHGLNERNKTPGSKRRTHLGLPTGVEPLANGKYRGQICVATKGGRDALRSEEQWDTPEPAAAWYQAQLEKRYGPQEGVHRPTSVNWPVFPPEMGDQTWELQVLDRVPEPAEAEIPF